MHLNMTKGYRDRETMHLNMTKEYNVRDTMHLNQLILRGERYISQRDNTRTVAAED
jgi:hypothetical protein